MNKTIVLIVLFTTILKNVGAQSNKITLLIEYTETKKNRQDSAELNFKYNTYKPFFNTPVNLYIINDSSYYTYNRYDDERRKYAKLLDSVTLNPTTSYQQNMIRMELEKLKPLKSFNIIYERKLGANTFEINDCTYEGTYYKKYLIKDTVERIAWQLQDETKIIDSFICQKATGTFRGRVWEAWFTNQIPIDAGPWKLSGLPGLILEAKDTSGIYRFACNSIQSPIKNYQKENTAVDRTAKNMSMKNWKTLLFDNYNAHIEALKSIISNIDNAGESESSSPEQSKMIEQFKLVRGEAKLSYSPIELFEQYK